MVIFMIGRIGESGDELDDRGGSHGSGDAVISVSGFHLRRS